MPTFQAHQRDVFLVFLILFNTALFVFFEKTPDINAHLFTGALTALLYLGASYYSNYRNETRIAQAFYCTGQLAAFTFLMATANHLLVLFQRPLIDPLLVHWDALLGFHWPAVIAWFQASPFWDSILTLAYMSSLPQIAVLVVVLAFTGRSIKLNRFMNAFFVAATITVGFWALFPSLGSLAYYLNAGLTVNTSGLTLDHAYVETLNYFFAGNWQALDADRMTGLIAFPSFHSVLAVVTIYGFWRVPHIWLPALALNTFVIISVPVDGGHHLVDVFAGVAVAIVSILLAEGLFSLRSIASLTSPPVEDRSTT